MRCASGSRVRRWSKADGPALLHEFRFAAVCESGVGPKAFHHRVTETRRKQEGRHKPKWRNGLLSRLSIFIFNPKLRFLKVICCRWFDCRLCSSVSQCPKVADWSSASVVPEAWGLPI